MTGACDESIMADPRLFGVVLLDALYVEASGAHGGDAAEAGLGGAHGGHDGDALGDGGAADFYFVLARGFAGGSVDDEADLAVLDHVEDVRPAFGELEELDDGGAGGLDGGGGAGGGVDVEAEGGEIPGQEGDVGFLRVLDGDEDVAAQGQGGLRGHLGLGVGDAHIGVDAHDLAGALHFRSEGDVDAEEFDEGEDGFLGNETGLHSRCAAETVGEQPLPPNNRDRQERCSPFFVPLPFSDRSS